MVREQVVQTIRQHADDLRRMNVEAVYLFGSVARGEATATSDVDVLIEVRRPFTYLDLVGVKDYLERVLGRRVDVGTLAMLRPAWKDEVMREAVRAA